MPALTQRNVRLTDEHWADLDVLSKAYGLADRAAVLRKLIDRAILLEQVYAQAEEGEPREPREQSTTTEATR